MTWTLFYQLGITSIVAAIGWYVAHHFTQNRDVKNKRREVKLLALMSVYRAFANSSNRPITLDIATRMEDAITEIQLLGSEEQVRLVGEFAESMSARNQASLDPVINSLRDDLRRELNLPPIKGNISWFRYNVSSQPATEDAGNSASGKS